MHRQDSTDETGVAQVEGTTKTQNLVRARERKAAAVVELRLQGADWDEIAKILGYPTPRAALVAFEGSLERQLADEDRSMLRKIAGQRLERLLKPFWRDAVGLPSIHDPDEPREPDLESAHFALKVIADQRKLFGLDAPTEVVVHSPSEAELLAWADMHYGQQGPKVVEFDIIEGDVEDDEVWEGVEDAVPAE